MILFLAFLGLAILPQMSFAQYPPPPIEVEVYGGGGSGGLVTVVVWPARVSGSGSMVVADDLAGRVGDIFVMVEDIAGRSSRNIHLLDQSGTTVFESTFNFGENTYDLNDLEAGTYKLVLSVNEQVIIRKEFTLKH